jgi:GH24 family phage-related lysozyme (muramidase)
MQKGVWAGAGRTVLGTAVRSTWENEKQTGTVSGTVAENAWYKKRMSGGVENGTEHRREAKAGLLQE